MVLTLFFLDQFHLLVQPDTYRLQVCSCLYFVGMFIVAYVDNDLSWYCIPRTALFFWANSHVLHKHLDQKYTLMLMQRNQTHLASFRCFDSYGMDDVLWNEVVSTDRKRCASYQDFACSTKRNSSNKSLLAFLILWLYSCNITSSFLSFFHFVFLIVWPLVATRSSINPVFSNLFRATAHFFHWKKSHGATPIKNIVKWHFSA